MRQIALVLLLVSAVATAEDFLDKATGLAISVPEGWARDSSREKQSLKFSATLDIAANKYVSFNVSASRATGFSSGDWYERQQKVLSRYITDVTDKFKKDEDTMVGGLGTAGFTLGGKSKQDPANTIHFRIHAVVNGDNFFKVTIVSHNGAHKDKADAINELIGAISFQAAEGSGEEPEAVEGKSATHEDKAGNYKITTPAGWEVNYTPNNERQRQRMVFVRRIDGEIVVSFHVWKIEINDPAIFSSGTPDQVLQEYFHKRMHLFNNWYGQDSHEVIEPQSDESVGLGGAPKAGSYEISGITVDEMEAVAEAEQKIKKGIKGVKVPEYKPLVLRGRIAMISPNAYLTIAIFNARGLAEDPQLRSEIEQIHENFAFLTTAAKPPPLVIAGKPVGNTMKDPALAKPRKIRAAVQLRKIKTYRVEYTATLPPGFVKFDGKADENLAMLLYAQDGNNSWVRIQIANGNHKISSEGKRKLVPLDAESDTWRSNWSAKARGAKFPRKLDKFALGKFKGKGFKMLTGKVEGFPGTLRAVASDKFPGRGWRTLIEVETRGDSSIFEDALKKFFKSLKAKDIKVK